LRINFIIFAFGHEADRTVIANISLLQSENTRPLVLAQFVSFVGDRRMLDPRILYIYDPCSPRQSPILSLHYYSAVENVRVSCIYADDLKLYSVLLRIT